MRNPMHLQDRHIVITGGAQGIGEAIAHFVLEMGGNVTLIDANETTLAAAAAQMDAARTLAIHGSVTDPAFVAHAIAEAAARFHRIDGLVNNAAIIRPAMIHKMAAAQWQDVIDVNLTGAYLCLQAVGQHMIARSKSGEAVQGAIVNVSADAGRKGSVGQINYSVSKAGLLGMTMSAALEWARYGIRVNSVCFGVVETPMTETIRSERFRDVYLAKIPMERWSTPAEVAQPVGFLLSEAASYITGQHLSVNGGAFMTS